MGVADPDRLAVMGWSYGGFMTSWTITQTHRFKAAVVGRGRHRICGVSPAPPTSPASCPTISAASRGQQFEIFQKHSPITYVKNVTTPTLVLHGEADVRVPTSQGYEYYHALKRAGRHRQDGGVSAAAAWAQEPKFILDIMQRHLDWVDKYVR